MRPLTPRQRRLLAHLAAFSDRDAFWRPMDVGGRDSSHHSHTLAALARRGLVERRRRWVGCAGGSWVYRVTAAGREALAASIK